MGPACDLSPVVSDAVPSRYAVSPRWPDKEETANHVRLQNFLMTSAGHDDPNSASWQNSQAQRGNSMGQGNDPNTERNRSVNLSTSNATNHQPGTEPGPSTSNPDVIPNPECSGPCFTFDTKLMRALTKKCNKLTSLFLEYCNIDYKSYLDVSECDWFEPASLMPLSKLPVLHELYMKDCVRLTECVAYASLATRYGFRQLRILDVRGSPISDSEISAVGWLPLLEELYCAPGDDYRSTSEHAHAWAEDLQPKDKLEPWENEEPEYFRNRTPEPEEEEVEVRPEPRPSAEDMASAPWWSHERRIIVIQPNHDEEDDSPATVRLRSLGLQVEPGPSGANNAVPGPSRANPGPNPGPGPSGTKRPTNDNGLDLVKRPRIEQEVPRIEVVLERAAVSAEDCPRLNRVLNRPSYDLSEYVGADAEPSPSTSRSPSPPPDPVRDAPDPARDAPDPARDAPDAPSDAPNDKASEAASDAVYEPPIVPVLDPRALQRRALRNEWLGSLVSLASRPGGKESLFSRRDQGNVPVDGTVPQASASSRPVEPQAGPSEAPQQFEPQPGPSNEVLDEEVNFAVEYVFPHPVTVTFDPENDEYATVHIAPEPNAAEGGNDENWNAENDGNEWNDGNPNERFVGNPENAVPVNADAANDGNGNLGNQENYADARNVGNIDNAANIPPVVNPPPPGHVHIVNPRPHFFTPHYHRNRANGHHCHSNPCPHGHVGPQAQQGPLQEVVLEHHAHVIPHQEPHNLQGPQIYAPYANGPQAVIIPGNVAPINAGPQAHLLMQPNRLRQPPYGNPFPHMAHLPPFRNRHAQDQVQDENQDVFNEFDGNAQNDVIRPHFVRFRRNNMRDRMHVDLDIHHQIPVHQSNSHLVTDSAILRFGRADNDDINYVHIARVGDGSSEQGNRPDRSNLRVLSVTGYRNITNRSLQHLATAAPHLRMIDFSETSVTQAGVDMFKAIRPNCEVVFSEYGRRR
ncbi:unnamed protein product [Chrysodeixis includens]|uniref:Uncharacterized protein n=1 Tax=Chrysodeixis includens TaxID=689277 RepID=A0A9N8L5E9_CHRIL|nr:unnamed protein product [Chrysodeixis includens]